MGLVHALLARAPATILAVALVVLGGAYAFEYLGGLVPCELCLAERAPWGVAVMLAGLAHILLGGARRWLLWACAVVLAGGAALAFYHVGVEQGWFAGPTACTGGATGATTLEGLRKQLEATQLVRCDEVQWTLFGVSLAGYNVLISAALAVFAALGARRKEA